MTLFSLTLLMKLPAPAQQSLLPFRAEAVEKAQQPLIIHIYLIATSAQKTLVYDIISSCSVKNKREVTKLACQKLIGNRDF
ncbi:MAG: hypothetical protein LBP53_03840 [Candidatus Peribacteria bacterium]|jgi:hypothetical protein|nr:hypothetical protein [Candidatus Peribacteria bacterium]